MTPQYEISSVGSIQMIPQSEPISKAIPNSYDDAEMSEKSFIIQPQNSIQQSIKELPKVLETIDLDTDEDENHKIEERKEDASKSMIVHNQNNNDNGKKRVEKAAKKQVEKLQDIAKPQTINSQPKPSKSKNKNLDHMPILPEIVDFDEELPYWDENSTLLEQFDKIENNSAMVSHFSTQYRHD